MRFEWDDAQDLFKHPLLSLLDNSDNYGEERWIGIGWLQHIIAVLVYTERDDVIRLISVRKATKNEVRLYEQRMHHTD